MPKAPREIEWRIACPNCHGAPLRIMETEFFAQRADESDDDVNDVNMITLITSKRDGTHSSWPEWDGMNPSDHGTAVRVSLQCAACASEMHLDLAEDLEVKPASPQGALLATLRMMCYSTHSPKVHGQPDPREPVAGVAGLDEEEIAALVRHLTTNVPAIHVRLLTRHYRQRRRPTEKEIRKLAHRVPVSQGDLVRLGVKLGRLHPACEVHAWDPWPLQALTLGELTCLDAIATAMATLGETVTPGSWPMKCQGESSVLPFRLPSR